MKWPAVFRKWHAHSWSKWTMIPGRRYLWYRTCSCGAFESKLRSLTAYGTPNAS